MTLSVFGRRARWARRAAGIWAAVAGVILAGVILAGTVAEAQSSAGQPAIAAQSAGTAPMLSVKIDSGTVTVGDPVTLRVELRAPAAVQPGAAAPFFREPLPAGVRLLHADSLHPLPGGTGTPVSVSAMTVVLFRPEPMHLPPIAVAYRATPGPASDTVFATVPQITVTPVVPAASGTLRDIKNIDMAPVSIRAAAAIVAGAVGVIVVVLIASRFAQRRSTANASSKSRTVPATPATPYDMAIARLAEIAGAWPAHRDIEAHYAGTADVLRRYLAEAHGVPALERTTPELLGALPERLAAPATRAAASGLLDAADLVKFARYAPAPPAPAELVEAARSVLSDWDGTA